MGTTDGGDARRQSERRARGDGREGEGGGDGAGDAADAAAGASDASSSSSSSDRSSNLSDATPTRLKYYMMQETKLGAAVGFER